jgi:hypothetical protein
MKPRLGLKDAGDIGNVVAALGVIFSLLVVAWEIRGNTYAIQAEARLQMVELNQQNLQWSIDPAFADLDYRAEQGFAALDTVEVRQFVAHAVGVFDMWEQGYFLNRDGLMSDDAWDGWNQGLINQTSTKAYRETWAVMKQFYSVGFQSFVDTAYGEE